MQSEYIIEINQENFDGCVMQEEKPVLLDFWASWCGPCRMVAPVLDSIADEMAGALIIGKVNVDEQPELSSRFGVMSIPTMVLMKDGHVVDTMVGAAAKNDIKAMIDKGIEKAKMIG